MKNNSNDLLSIAKEILKIADDKKAENMVCLDVEGISDIASYLVVARRPGVFCG